MRAEVAIALKDLRLLARDRTNAFFVLVFPLAIAIFFGSVFGIGTGAGSISLAVLNECNGALAQAYVRDLASAATLKIVPVPSREQGETLVRRGTASAMIVLPADFDAKASRMLSGGQIEIEFLSDPSRSAERGLLQGLLTQMGFQTMLHAFESPTLARSLLSQSRLALMVAPDMQPQRRKDIAALLDAAQTVTGDPEASVQENAKAKNIGKHGENREVSGAVGDDANGDTNTSSIDNSKRAQMLSNMPEMVRVNMRELAQATNQPSNPFAITFPQGIAWGLMGCVVAFAASLAEERSRGTMVRLATAPIQRMQVLLGKWIGCFTSCMVVILLLTLVAVTLLHVQVQSWPLLALGSVTCAFAFSGLAMGMAGIFRSEGSARSAGSAVMLILAMVGGGTIPLAFMPPFLRTASGISPFHWAIISIEGAVWRGFSLAEMALPLLILVVVGVLGFFVSVLAMQWSKN